MWFKVFQVFLLTFIIIESLEVPEIIQNQNIDEASLSENHLEHKAEHELETEEEDEEETNSNENNTESNVEYLPQGQLKEKGENVLRNTSNSNEKNISHNISEGSTDVVEQKQKKSNKNRENELKKMFRKVKGNTTEEHCYRTAYIPCVYVSDNAEELKDLLSVDNKGLSKLERRHPRWEGIERSPNITQAIKSLTKILRRPRSNPTQADMGAAQMRFRRTVDRSLCKFRNSQSAPGTNRICGECSTVTDMGVEWSPRYLNEVVCNPHEPLQCFGDEGACVQMSMTILLRKTGATSETANTEYNLRTGCVCELYPHSALAPINEY